MPHVCSLHFFGLLHQFDFMMSVEAIQLILTVFTTAPYYPLHLIIPSSTLPLFLTPPSHIHTIRIFIAFIFYTQVYNRKIQEWSSSICNKIHKLLWLLISTSFFVKKNDFRLLASEKICVFHWIYIISFVFNKSASVSLVIRQVPVP